MPNLATLAWLVCGHGLADFVLQSEAMMMYKSRRVYNILSPEKAAMIPPWGYWLGAHAMLHGGVVTALTGSILLGALETIAHAVIDYMKCEGKISSNRDQVLHLLCKLLWWGILFIPVVH